MLVILVIAAALLLVGFVLVRAILSDGAKKIDLRELEEGLEKEFRRYRDGEISLESYRATVRSEHYYIRDMLSIMRADRPTGEDARYLHDMKLSEAEEALEATRWRLEWAMNRELDEKAGHYEEGLEFIPDGPRARFDYVDAYGTATKREISNWEDKGYKIVGFDIAKQAERTFRKERISNWTVVA